MVAVAEGGIVSSADSEFDTNVNNALYGININGSTRMIYDSYLVVDMEEM